MLPVLKSITVSAPYLMAEASFSSSSSTLDESGEVPILALILMDNSLPMPIGTREWWLILAGITIFPSATRSRMKFTSRFSLAATLWISGVTMPFAAKYIWVWGEEFDIWHYPLLFLDIPAEKRAIGCRRGTRTVIPTPVLSGSGSSGYDLSRFRSRITAPRYTVVNIQHKKCFFNLTTCQE